jgi:hypothetical protein
VTPFAQLQSCRIDGSGLGYSLATSLIGLLLHWLRQAHLPRNGSNRSTRAIITLIQNQFQLAYEPGRSHKRRGLLHMMILRAEVGPLI